MFRKTESLAWFVLIVSFLACVVLAIGVPLSVRWYLLNDTRDLVVLLQPRAGTVTRQLPRGGVSLVVSEPLELPPDNTLSLSDDAEALLLFYAPDARDVPIITVQLYGRTELTLDSAATPRFTLSRLPNRVNLSVRHASNLRVTVETAERKTHLDLRTPHGFVEMNEGSFAAVVGEAQTEFVVTSGLAYLPGETPGDSLVLTSLQRTILTQAGVQDIYVGERDILRARNGDFETPLEEQWRVSIGPSHPEDIDGEPNVRQTQLPDGRSVVTFSRVGRRHASAGILQEINQDIRGAQSLRVRARVRVELQTLGVCGTVGTECPIMLRLQFVDQTTGVIREWLQGFYAIRGTDAYEPVCIVCSWRAQHIQVAQLGAWYDYESPDLLATLRGAGIEPASLYTVEIYASGHTFSAAIDEIAILIEE